MKKYTQKALEELKKKKFSRYDKNDNVIYPNPEVVKWSDVEKCFEVKDAKNK